MNPRLRAGDQDHTVPPAVVNASYRLQQRNAGITEIAHVPGRGHALTIDHGWKEIAETSLAFVRRFAAVRSPAMAVP